MCKCYKPCDKCSYCHRQYCDECMSSYDLLRRKIVFSYIGWIGIGICYVCRLDHPK